MRLWATHLFSLYLSFLSYSNTAYRLRLGYALGNFYNVFTTQSPINVAAISVIAMSLWWSCWLRENRWHSLSCLWRLANMCDKNPAWWPWALLLIPSPKHLEWGLVRSSAQIENACQRNEHQVICTFLYIQKSFCLILFFTKRSISNHYQAHTGWQHETHALENTRISITKGQAQFPASRSQLTT